MRFEFNLPGIMETNVIITIDTEVGEKAPACQDPFDRYVLGRLQGNLYGAPWIADMLESYKYRGVFFLDVYGSARFGATRYPELCDRLLKGGHSVELHTHPGWMYDEKRRNMREYSLSEQKTVLSDGMALVKDWTGRLPKAHRAGNYGANEDTLRALGTNGIFLDSSFIEGRKNCHLPSAGTNAPVMMNGIWEVPVTTVPEPIHKLGFRLPFWTRRFWMDYQKLDPNYMTGAQLCRSVMEVYGRIPYALMLFHSRSFIRQYAQGDNFEPDVAAITAFRYLLNFLAKEKIQVTTFERVASQLALEANRNPSEVI